MSCPKGLLPTGLQDVLAPGAAHEAGTVEALIRCFAGHGYERVKPPLMEFEETLLAGAGASLAQQTFRLMDPVSQHMMGLRADMTPQVARIAATRLANAPRPLRLCYAGQVLQVRGSQLRPERQFGQVGAELIGAFQPRADAEVILVAAEALAGLGIAGLSIDLNLPTVVGGLAAGLGLSSDTASGLRSALDRKDEAAVKAAAGAEAPIFLALLDAVGPADRALEALAGLDLPDGPRVEVERLHEVTGLIRHWRSDLTLTVDPVEHRGFEYQTGLSFILFAKGVRGELGRGGRYAIEEAGGRPESATGFSLFMDTVLRALTEPAPAPRIYLPVDCPPERARELRAEGWLTVAALEEDRDPAREAGRLGCSHLWAARAIRELS